MRALRESASRGERHQARHMRQETGQHDKAGDAPVEEQAVGPSMPNERRGDAARSMGASAVSLPAAAINATTKPGSAVVPVLMQRRNLLEGKKEFRPSRSITKLMPRGGDGLQDAVPQRKDFGEAGAEGDAAHAAAMKDFSLSALGDSGMSEGRRDANFSRVGLFGYWMERNNYGRYVEWKVSEGPSGRQERTLVPAVTESGKEKIPPEAAMMEYFLAMGTANVESRPKGGWAEYRSQPHARLGLYGKKPSELMGEEKGYGKGSYADKSFRYITLAEYVKSIRGFYRQILENNGGGGVNPADYAKVKNETKRTSSDLRSATSTRI